MQKPGAAVWWIKLGNMDKPHQDGCPRVSFNSPRLAFDQVMDHMGPTSNLVQDSGNC